MGKSLVIWKKISANQICKICASAPKRLKAIAEKGGGTTLNSRVELKFLKLVLLLYQAGNIVCNHHAKYFTKILTNKQGK